jgi:hypothetical protein
VNLLVAKSVSSWFCWLLVFIGAALMWKGARIVIKSLRARSWPTAMGRVLDSRRRAILDNRGRTYQAYILYEYSVDGVTRRSDVWRLGAGTSSYTKASASAVERYPVGAAVTVFVNPDNPADAVLEPANPSWFLLIAGMVFAAAGLLLFSRAS